MFGRFETQSHKPSIYSGNFDLNIVIDAQAFTDFSGQYYQWLSPFRL